MDYNAQTAVAAQIAGQLLAHTPDADNSEIERAVKTAWRIVEASIQEQQHRLQRR